MKKTLAYLAFAAVIGIAQAPALAQCPSGVCRYGGGRYSYATRGTTIRYYQGTTRSAQATQPCAPVVAVPQPCEAVQTVQPCAPCETTNETVEPCAPVETVAPCDPCETISGGEFTPGTIQRGIKIDECVGGACPIRRTAQAATNVAAKTARGAVNVVAGALERLNATRARYGLTALQLDANLEAGAQRQAGVCATSGTLQHGYGAAEILAQNSQGIETALTQWLQSPGHRALLLNGGYRYAGVGIVKDRNGRVWCAVRFR